MYFYLLIDVKLDLENGIIGSASRVTLRATCVRLDCKQPKWSPFEVKVKAKNLENHLKSYLSLNPSMPKPKWRVGDDVRA